MFKLNPWDHPRNVSIKKEGNSLSSLQNEVNRIFDNFSNSFQSSWHLPSAWTGDQKISPLMDIVENDRSFKVEAELPGMDQDDVEVTVNDSYLTIKGEKRDSKEEKDDNYIRRERYYGSYLRTIALPETANTEKVKATFKKGVLWVEIPKKEEAVKPSRKIEIEQAA